MREQWRSIWPYLGFYEVSNLGRVRSLDRTGVRGQVLSTNVHNSGETRVSIQDPIRKQRRALAVRRLVALAFVPGYSKGDYVGYHGDPLDCSSSNLFWGDSRTVLSRAQSRKATVTTPSGDVLKVIGIRRFAEENGLDPSSLYRVANGSQRHHKGFSVVYGH